MECLRIKFILPNHYPLSFKSEKEIPITLPEGIELFDVNVIKNDAFTSYTLKSKPLTHKIANSTIEKIQSALILSIFNFDIGLLISPNLASGTITEYGKNLLGDNVNSDFVGVKVIDCSTKHLHTTISINGLLSGDEFAENLCNNIINFKIVDSRLKRAIELYNSTNYLTKVNNSGSFILLMSAIECLITQKENSPEIISIIVNAQAAIETLAIPKDICDSIIGSLSYLKNESIKRSGKILIEDLFNGSAETYNSFDPIEFFSRAYDLRSKLVHEGMIQTKYLDIHNVQMKAFTISCLRKYYYKNYS